MKMAIFSLRSAASFRNQSALLYKTGVKMGYLVEEKDLAERVNFPHETWDRMIILAPLWPRYCFDSVRLAAPWVARKTTLYGPVDGPYTLNVQLFEVLKNLPIVTTSKFCFEALRRSGVQARGICYHGINHEDFKFGDVEGLPRMKGLRQRYPGRTIFFSNINPLHRKGLPHLAKALKVLQEKRPGKWIFILHTGRAKALELCPDLAKTQDLIIEDAYNVLPYGEIAFKTACCDVFVWPSLLEGFGLPLLEAMASRKAIVCLNVEPMNELVSHDEAFMFPCSGLIEEKWDAPGCMAQLHDYDPELLAESMLVAMDNPKERDEKAKAAYKRSLDFNYLKVYKPLIRGEI